MVPTFKLLNFKIMKSKWPLSPALLFVVAIGIVSLFADMTYEGGASIHGLFLGKLGASAAAISIIAGVGEFLGYAIRLPAGFLGDKTKHVWLLTFVGYITNLLAVPALALTGSWKIAAALMIAERVGRAIRKPSVDSMLSYTTHKLGKGWAYGFHTALDETGAMLGPLVVAATLFWKGKENFQMGYAILIIPALLSLIALTIAERAFPNPALLEKQNLSMVKGFTSSYWITMLAGACFAAGLMSFELISYHLFKTNIVSSSWIPLLLTFASGAGIIASLFFGKLFDRYGLSSVIAAILLSALFSPCIFFGNVPLVLLGLVLWGIGYAVQDTLLKAIVAGMLPEGRRNLTFGLFYTGYGLGWLGGSAITGLLYEYSIGALVMFAITVQLISIPLFMIGQQKQHSSL